MILLPTSYSIMYYQICHCLDKKQANCVQGDKSTIDTILHVSLASEISVF